MGDQYRLLEKHKNGNFLRKSNQTKYYISLYLAIAIDIWRKDMVNRLLEGCCCDPSPSQSVAIGDSYIHGLPTTDLEKQPKPNLHLHVKQFTRFYFPALENYVSKLAEELSRELWLEHWSWHNFFLFCMVYMGNGKAWLCFQFQL